MSKKQTASGYDRLAAGYDRLARLVYGNALRAAQTSFLQAIPKHSEVLVVGGGSGWFLEQLLLRCAPKFVLYVELSPKMLALAKDRIARNCPAQLADVEFVEGDVEGIAEEMSYDVVVTHCLLDMFDGLQLQGIVLRLRAALRPGGRWYFSDFRHAGRWPMSWVSRLLIWIMYRFFRWFCGIPAHRLPDFGKAFKAAGMEMQDEKLFFGGMIAAQLLQKA